MTKTYNVGDVVRTNGTGRYTFKSRWHRFMAAVRHYTKIAAVGVLLLGMLTAAFYIGFSQREIVATRSVAEAAIVDMTPQKIDSLKVAIVNEIAKCETGDAPQESGIVKYDNNKKGTLTGKHISSIGVMQFKIGTIQKFEKDLHGKDLSNYEAILLALDNEKAKALAKEAIFGLQGALWNWTCATDEMATKVGIIKELEK